MGEQKTVSELDTQANQPSSQQWILIAVVALMTACGIILFLSGSALTAYSWVNERQAEAEATTAAATAVVVDREQDKKAASEWPLLLFDTFNDNQNGWIDGEIDDEYSDIQVAINGVYRWTATAKKGFHWRVWPESDLVSDFYLSVDVQNLGENHDAQYGLIFRENEDAYFYWEITDNQQYRVFSYQNDWIELIPETYAAAIQPGEVNHLVVLSENDEFRLWINDQFVGQFTSSFPSNGQAGIAIGLSYEGEQSVIIFDNFELRGFAIEE
jgi:hypothetical protein